jgi:hypothetical protein
LAVANPTASERKPIFSHDPARDSPDVQSATIIVPLSRRTSVLVDHAPSGAVATKTNVTPIARRT